MFWIILSIIIILGLAYAMHKATVNTPFDSRRACTPDIKHLMYLEKENKKNK